jgi:hypothetical protein
MSNFFVVELNACKQGIPANDFVEKYFLKGSKKDKLSTFNALKALK